jgi:hypothetical protein
MQRAPKTWHFRHTAASIASDDSMSPLSPSTLSPLLLTAAVAFAYYRRIRRQFGRQPYQAKRSMVRTGLLGVAAAALAFAAVALPVAGVGLAIGAGLAVGAALGAFALRHTQIEASDGARWYTPNPWIGGALSLLLIGRLAWRFGQGPLAGAGAAAPAMQNASPLTLGIAATLVAYYLVNGAGLAWRMRSLAA